MIHQKPCKFHDVCWCIVSLEIKLSHNITIFSAPKSNDQIERGSLHLDLLDFRAWRMMWIVLIIELVGREDFSAAMGGDFLYDIWYWYSLHMYISMQARVYMWLMGADFPGCCWCGEKWYRLKLHGADGVEFNYHIQSSQKGDFSQSASSPGKIPKWPPDTHYSHVCTCYKKSKVALGRVKFLVSPREHLSGRNQKHF